MRVKLEILQGIADELFSEQGLTDEVLSLQVAINKLRHKHNISDKNNKTYKEYVQ